MFRWTDKDNNILDSLEEFTQSFLVPSMLYDIITKYIIRFGVAGKPNIQKPMIVMRPYQIFAVKAVIDKVTKPLISEKANGYIFHTTGSGKTLTSYKCAQIAADRKEVYKVVFLVDRKDLDDQTADLAFVQHIVYHMTEGGRAAILLPHGVLFRGNAEKAIRTALIEQHNIIDAIIGLPANCFYGASIAVSCIVLRKDRNGDSEDICFIDASKNFKTANGKNYITNEDIDKIMQAYQERKDIEHFCSIVSLDKIRENDYNLNIPLYVEGEKDIEEHDLGELFQDYAKLEKQAEELKRSINQQLASFGIKERFLCLEESA